MKQLSQMSLEELHKQQQSTKTIGGLWIGLLLAMAIVAGVSTFQMGFTVLTVLPALFLPLALMSADRLKKNTSRATRTGLVDKVSATLLLTDGALLLRYVHRCEPVPNPRIF